ncbi:hypothetical protein GDO78_016347 [Eleutherodactylus coqui]|uniref:Uncharacterized protein n=1 Tax=Eleutherodactylus coqui TaxID=57060 RepID=A0A8J6B0D4_ELECQ|nr:hypothetical protein GDO78_016347 [Eleutherodactylus coqui]
MDACTFPDSALNRDLYNSLLCRRFSDLCTLSALVLKACVFPIWALARLTAAALHHTSSLVHLPTMTLFNSSFTSCYLPSLFSTLQLTSRLALHTFPGSS